MNSTSRLNFFVLVVAALAASGSATVRAAETAYPSRPIRMLVPYPPGGGLDPVGRAVAQKFGEATGQSLVLDNRGGAGGVIATETVVRAAPDGYTLLLASNGQITIAPHVYAKVPFDVLKDLVPVIHLVDSPMVLFINASFPAQSVKELVAEAKAKPGTISLALSGVGGVGHLAVELFKQKAGVDIVPVPYRGAGLAMGDVASGSVQGIISALSAGKPLLDTGRVRALAVTTRKRAATIPNVPTFIELGFPDIEVPLWIGMMAPRGTPQAIVRKLEIELAKAISAPENRERLGATSNEVVAAGPAEFGRMIHTEFERFRGVVKAANIRIE